MSATVTVLDNNDNTPVFTGVFVFNIAENIQNQTVVGRMCPRPNLHYVLIIIDASINTIQLSDLPRTHRLQSLGFKTFCCKVLDKQVLSAVKRSVVRSAVNRSSLQ